MSAKICVLGAGGAIGSRLAIHLLEQGYEVTAVVRRLETAVRIGRFPIKIERADLMTMSTRSLSEILKGHDLVIDCTYASLPDPAACIEASQTMAKTLVDACADSGIRSLIHYGTISVYPSGRDEIDEETPCDFQNIAYGDGKLAAERILLQNSASLNVIVLQLPVVFGPFMGWTKSIAAQLTQGVLQVPDDIRGRCDALHVDDVVTATQQAMRYLIQTQDEVSARILLPAVSNASWNDVYREFASKIKVSRLQEVTRSAYEQHLSEQQRKQRPWLRLKRTFQSDGDFRQLVLAQWGIRTLYRVAKKRRGQAGMDEIKQRLARQVGVQADETARLLPLSVLSTIDRMPAVNSQRATQMLGFKASISLDDIARDSADWMAWADLIE